MSAKYKHLSISTYQQDTPKDTPHITLPSQKKTLPLSSNTPYRFSNFASYIDFMTQRVGRVDTGKILEDFKSSQETNKPNGQSITKGGNFDKYKDMSDSNRLNDVYVKKFHKMSDVVQLVKESQCERKSDKPVERFVTKNFSFLSFIYNSAHNQFWLQHIQDQALSESIYIPAIQQYSIVSLDIKGQNGLFIILEYNQHKAQTDLMMIYSIDPLFYDQFERKASLWDIPKQEYHNIRDFFQKGLSHSQYELYDQVTHISHDSEFTIVPDHHLSSIKKDGTPGKDLASDFELTLKNI